MSSCRRTVGPPSSTSKRHCKMLEPNSRQYMGSRHRLVLVVSRLPPSSYTTTISPESPITIVKETIAELTFEYGYLCGYRRSDQNEQSPHQRQRKTGHHVADGGTPSMERHRNERHHRRGLYPYSSTRLSRAL